MDFGIIWFFPGMPVNIQPARKLTWNQKNGRNFNFAAFFCFFVFCLVFNVCSLLFWYVPFILLHDLVSFQRFPPFCGLFLSIRYAFCYIPCSCLPDFAWFFNSMLASLDFATMFYKLEILRSLPFNWPSVALI